MISRLIEETTYGNVNRLSVKDGELSNHFVDTSFHTYFLSYNYFVSRTDMTKNYLHMKTDIRNKTICSKAIIRLQKPGQRERDQNDLGQQASRRISFSHSNAPTTDRISSIRWIFRQQLLGGM